MVWVAIIFICVVIILIVAFNTSQRRGGAKEARKPSLPADSIEMPKDEVVTTEDPRLHIREDYKEKKRRTKQERSSRETVSYGGVSEGAKTYVRIDWLERFEDSGVNP